MRNKKIILAYVMSLPLFWNTVTAATANLNNGSTVAKQINIDSGTLNNQYGKIIQTGTAGSSITATTRLDNTGGVIGSNGNTTITVGNFDNRGGTIQVSGQAAKCGYAQS